jgi:hypothetical protein
MLSQWQLEDSAVKRLLQVYPKINALLLLAFVYNTACRKATVIEQAQENQDEKQNFAIAAATK